MAIPFLSNSLIRMVSERVLSNVLEQLPKAVASGGVGQGNEGSPALAAHAIALKSMGGDLEKLRDSIDRVDERLARLEARMQWRVYAWILVTALIVYGIGFGTAVGLRLLGLI